VFPVALVGWLDRWQEEGPGISDWREPGPAEVPRGRPLGLWVHEGVGSPCVGTGRDIEGPRTRFAWTG